MINLMNLVEGEYDYGCVMAQIDDDAARKLLEFNHKRISEDLLFVEDQSFGREYHPHVTIKYGLVNSYSEDQMREMLKDVMPFNVELKGIGIFEGDNRYDVVKFEVDSPILRQLNERFSFLPNHDSHPIYNPHMTLAYVRRGFGKRFVKEAKKRANVPVKTIIYSDRGEKLYYNLSGTRGV
jgi:2'-5' RNA ligase